MRKHGPLLEQRAVLAHELAHAKRYDGLIHFLVQIVCSVYWFNPIVWMAARRMRLERERACDDYALNAGATPEAYADHLLLLASGGKLQWAPGHDFDRTPVAAGNAASRNPESENKT